MAEIKSDVYTKQSTYLNLTKERQDDGQLVSGVLLQADVTVTLTGNPSNDDTFALVELPEGATIIPQLCKVNTNFAGAFTGDIIVGDDDDTAAADDDRYCATLALDTGGGTEFTFAGGAAATAGYQLGKNSLIYATAKGTPANGAAADTLRFTIVYRVQA